MKQLIHPSLSTQALNEFFLQLQKKGTELHAIEIFEKGSCVLQWSLSPYTCHQKREMYSISKSFTSTAAGLAYGRKKLHPEDLVLPYFPEYAALCSHDARWQKLKIKHLLSMNCGHDGCVMQQMAFASNSVEAFFSAPLCHEPGTHFAYSTAATCMMAELVRRATGQTVAELLAQEIFPPLEIDEFQWQACTDGCCQGGTGLQVSCDDIAKLGLLYLNRGRWNGQQLLAEEWVELASACHSVNDANGSKDWCAGYGFQFWMNQGGGYRGDGAFGQLCVVLPQWECVVAITAESMDMPAELDTMWQLLDNLHQPAPLQTEILALPTEYKPKTGDAPQNRDTGWMFFKENQAGFTGLRIQTGPQQTHVWLITQQSQQKITAYTSAFCENRLYAKNFRPALVRQMPRLQPQLLHFAAAARQQENRLLLECRSLNTPHAFEMQFEFTREGVTMQLISPLDVFGSEKQMQAVYSL